ncbi:hypothetical protein ES705_18278 [subsurface metagenome]
MKGVLSMPDPKIAGRYMILDLNYSRNNIFNLGQGEKDSNNE